MSSCLGGSKRCKVGKQTVMRFDPCSLTVAKRIDDLNIRRRYWELAVDSLDANIAHYRPDETIVHETEVIHLLGVKTEHRANDSIVIDVKCGPPSFENVEGIHCHRRAVIGACNAQLCSAACTLQPHS